jgi:DNA-binding NarL/FixJ family response regulator
VRNADVLLRAIQGAYDGLTVLDPLLLGAERISQTSPVAQLSVRQRELLRLIAQGLSNSAIAAALDLRACLKSSSTIVSPIVLPSR